MRPILFVVLSILLFTSACVQPASTPSSVTGRNPFTPEPAAVQCIAADLQVSSSSSQDDAGAISLGITLINQSGHACSVQPPAQVSLVSGNQPLDVQLAQAQTDALPLKIATGESIILLLNWRNYCGEKLQNTLGLRLNLSATETLTMTPHLPALPRCEDAKKPSMLTVSPYSYPP